MNRTDEANDNPFKWWGRHRAKYNLALIFSGIGAFGKAGGQIFKLDISKGVGGILTMIRHGLIQMTRLRILSRYLAISQKNESS